MEQVFTALNQIHQLSPSLKDFLSERATKVIIKKNEYLIYSGSLDARLYFITAGLFRSYYLQKGKPTTFSFAKENQIIISPSGFFFHRPATDFVQAMQHSEVLFITKTDLEFCYNNFSETNIIARRIMNDFYMANARIIALLKIRNASERYLTAMRWFPDLILRVPVKHLASYLNISYESLSRIRSQLLK
jgi:CRP/FNR family transcriptional regulator, anaerobic regulatory protein